MQTIDSYFKGYDDSDYRRTGNPLSPVRPIGDIECMVHTIIDNSTELTVTFKECLINTWDNGTLKELVMKTIERVMKRVKDPYTVVLVGEHSKVGRFHYHGIFRGIANDVVGRLKKALTRNIGRTEIKAITYTTSYEKYMFKSYKEYPPEEWGEHSYIIIQK